MTIVSKMEGLFGVNCCKGRDLPAIVWFYRVLGATDRD